ncbi:MAG: D-alanyl-D-alanine carboxypeptidase family protein [Clostridia bacterium]|nr:D-alanyl-D-alanine carboxypeptidase family protein [Clostridia bacterium]
MADDKKKDAYTRLGHILIVLIVLTAIAAIGFFYAKNTVDQQLAQLQQQRDEQNAARIEMREQWLKEQEAAQAKPVDESWPQPNPEGWDIVDISSFDVKNGSNVEIERSTLETSGMMLVNRWHYLPSDFTDERFETGDELISIMTQSGADGFAIQTTNRSVRLQTPAYHHLLAMLKAAKDDGLENFMIQEGFRTNARQTEYFLAEQAKWENRYTGEVLIEKARESVNVPGTSEYQTGLSFNLRRLKNGDSEFNNVKFIESEHFSWLWNHSWEYGFVFRFPVSGYPTASATDKSWKTGESKKLMIFRYVGEAPAAVMHQKDFCLEEMIDYIAAHPHLAVYQNGELKYEIYRMADTGGSVSVKVPVGADVEASIDNMGGVIVSLYY